MQKKWGGLKALLFVLYFCAGCAPDEVDAEAEVTLAEEHGWFDEVAGGLVVSGPLCPAIPRQGLPGSGVAPCWRWVETYRNDPLNPTVRDPKLICDSCKGPGEVDLDNPSDHRLYASGVPKGPRRLNYSMKAEEMEWPWNGNRIANVVFSHDNGSGRTITYSGQLTMTQANGYSASIATPALPDGVTTWNVTVLPVVDPYYGSQGQMPHHYSHRIMLVY